MYADRLHRRRAPVWLAAMLYLAAAGAAAEVQLLPTDPTLPITLDADSSELDMDAGKLTFKGLRISQGTLGIESDEAQASRLDFENSVWTFTGNVVIDNDTTRIYCDRAEISFRDHRLHDAMLEGAPARFEQLRREDGKLTEGHASIMKYDVGSGIIRMSGDAWLSDGANEISGALISYDLLQDYIIADGVDGQVSMKITPPEKEPAQAVP